MASPIPSAAVLSVRDLTVAYGQDHPVVQDFRLEIAAGETAGVVGESGSGKSTAAMAVPGLLPRSARIRSGSIRLQGEELVGLGNRTLRPYRGRRIGVIFQDPMTSLNPFLKIGIQCTEHLRRHLGLTRSAARRQALTGLGEVGIPDPEAALRRYPHQFSGGQRQRIVISMALACDPALVIADEPTTALDVTLQAQVLDLLARLQDQRGVAVLLISHDFAVVANVCDHLTVMQNGHSVEHGPTGALLRDPRHAYTRQLLRAVPRIG
jgi:peptide/nickel transport system ATP-binding protein